MRYPKIFMYLSMLTFLPGFRDKADWFKLENAACKASFPSPPKNDTTTVQTAKGPLTVYTYTLELDEHTLDSNLFYSFAETVYPKGLEDQLGPSFLKGVFEGAISSALKNYDGKLISQKDISLKEAPGREIKIDYGNGVAIVTMRIYSKGMRMFALQTIALKGKELNRNAARFFNSFAIK